MAITDTVPYDVEARLEWSPTVGKLAVRKVCCTALPATVARGLSPASGPKRVLAARKAGLLPETKPGKPAGA